MIDSTLLPLPALDSRRPPSHCPSHAALNTLSLTHTQVFATNRDDFLAAFCMSALVNLTCFFAVELTSPVTFKVAGCVKNLIVVWYGAAVHGDHVTVTQIGGYFVSVLGFAMYVKLKNATTGSGGGGSKAAAASAAAGGAKKYR